ncbi:MAG: GAF domain-containing protein [Chloroflexi bacterium]|nr:GAF domain-containing protein [Chloroflexota bacterium]
MTSQDIGPQVEHLYAINQMVVSASGWKPALEEISRMARSFFIFDNLVVYKADPQTQNMEVIFARAMGRGKRAEADISWGEEIANTILREQKIILTEPQGSEQQDRLALPFILGIPLQVSGQLIGALIIIRFGGPPFNQEGVQLARFIANQIALLIERDELSKRYSQLAERDRQNQLKEDFVSTITHELRNPLGFIKGYTTTLLRSDTTWDQQTQNEFLQIIDTETDHLQELIDNILDSARLQSGQMKMNFQYVRLDALVNDIILRAKMNFPEMKIRTRLPEKLEPVIGDSRRLSQVIENIISNAAKYAPESDVMISIHQTKDKTRISISDSGPGIPTEHLPRIFERFFRNPEQSPTIRGSGLGLFICKLIIHAHAGEILVKSKVGEGTEFQILLPHHSPKAMGLG